MLLLDLNKAFDLIWHKGLLLKLCNYKFSDHILKIINSFLEDRFFNTEPTDISCIPNLTMTGQMTASKKYVS